MKLNAYGRKIEIVQFGENWKVFFFGEEGKKRIADDIIVPSNIKKRELKNYIEDLLHEWATAKNNQVVEIE